MTVIVGIAGGTASGKTTLSRRLHQALPERSVLILHDRYYRSVDVGRDPSSWNYDHPDALETELLAKHLAALRLGESVQLPRYDFAQHRREQGTDLATPRPVILVEGILVLADPALRACFDHAVFVDAPADVRLMRRLRRDVAERGRDPMGVLTQYESSVRPMHELFVEPSRAYSEIVVDGTSDIERTTQQVLSLLSN